MSWFLLVSCTRAPVEPGLDLASGAYALERYNDSALPFDLGPSPPNGNQPSGCPILITDGRLTINKAARMYAFSYSIRNGCTMEFMSQLGLQGTYELDGSRLTFRVAGVDGEVFENAGTLTSKYIIFATEDEVLHFAR